ncbi:MAG: CehA/McbA family metallohydrolase [Labilithrix sp.]|nr:CehA/McbA family metallohydrolase [Labilithrix sp.]
MRSFAPAYLVSIALFALGVIGGFVDPRPERPVVRRGGYRVLEGDFHAHTAWSDGSLSPFGLVRQADRRGIDVLGVTEHNTVYPAKMARWYAELTGGPLVVVGEEVTTSRFHVIALGIEKTVEPSLDASVVLEAIHAEGGVAIAAHPVKRFWPALVPLRERFDGAEVMHPIAFSSGRSEGWAWGDMIAFYNESAAPLAAIGSSDYHWMSPLGVCRTLVFVDERPTAKGVVDAIRARRTVTFDPEGRAFGDPALVELLRKEPYVPRSGDYEYRGAGPVDRALRAAGFFGLVGVLFLRARRKP